MVLKNNRLRLSHKFNVGVSKAHAAQHQLHTHLKELLDDVIPKNIHHELVGRLQDLAEDELALC